MDDLHQIHIPQDIEDLTTRVIDSCFDVHRELGPGLLESTYEACLAHELTVRGLHFVRQQEIPLNYRSVHISVAYRADFLVESKLLLELKSTETLTSMHKAQVITYLKLLKMPLGLLVNFNSHFLKDGIIRVLGFPPRKTTLSRRTKIQE